MKNQAVVVDNQFNKNDFDASIDQNKAEKILSSIKLPPQPITLITLQKMLATDADLEWSALSTVISKDMTISAGMLKTINSPFFGLGKKIDDIGRAVMLLGINNVINIVNTLSLKESMRSMNLPEIDTYFDYANDVALVCAGLAAELKLMEPETAYTMGLFHDCGIPVMLNRFDDYGNILKLATESEDQLLVEVEDRNLNMNHAVVGYYICKNWNLSEDICQAVLSHHNVQELLSSGHSYTNETVMNMVAILSVAEYIAYAFRGEAQKTDWDYESGYVLNYLDISIEELDFLKSSMFEKLGD